MQKNQAENIVTKTFQNSYDDNRFEYFIHELLNEASLQYGSDYRSPPSSSYKVYIEKYRVFGVYKAPLAKRILFISVKLKKSSSLDRARVMQRNFAADILRGKISNTNGADAALIAFYGEDAEDWRLSFVTLDTEISCNEKGICASEVLSPAKRFSYLVGVHEPCHTCMKYFCPLIEDEKNQLTIDQLLDVFHVETVSDEFFEEYKNCYLYLTKSLQEIVNHDITVKTEFEKKGLVVTDFSKKLLGQIVFLYFLQKKGWLGVKRGENWGSGPKDFMQQLFHKKIVPYDNFFDDILEPLFYEALARKNDSDYYSRFDVRIPFLNGGLFEAEYDWVNTNIVIENSVFKKIFETFDRYNFTVKEDEPLEREVAVDPEMLGKVFERLLDVNDSKSNGAVYTPRFIVHYICQQSLVEYLERHTNIPRDDIEFFIGKGDELYANTLQNVIDAESGKKNTSTGGLPESIASQALEIDTLLCNIKIADPAVGSGAFPVGMMNEIVKARTALTPCLNRWDESRNAYNLKRQTIENSIYGVDVDPSAVDISKLRFWLSLIVDEENPKEVRPLPNLDHKIVAGNSLLESFQGIKLFDPTILSPELDSVAGEITEIDFEIRKLRDEQASIPWGTGLERYQIISGEIQALEKRKDRILRDDPQKQILQTLSPIKTAKFKQSRKGLKEYRILQIQYFNEQNKEKKAELREAIESHEWQIIEREAEYSGNSKVIDELQKLKGKKGKPFFLWKLYFSDVFTREDPGFDCIIGNPPYVRVQKLSADLREEYKKTWSVAHRKFDISILFLELGHSLLNKTGSLAYITSNQFVKTSYGEKIRKYLLDTKSLVSIDDFCDLPVFNNKQTYVSIFRLNNQENNHIKYYRVPSLPFRPPTKDDYELIPLSSLNEKSWSLGKTDELALLQKIKEVSNYKLKDYAKARTGLFTGLDELLLTHIESDSLTVEDELVLPVIEANGVGRYSYATPTQKCYYPYRSIGDKTELVPLDELQTIYPSAYKFITEHETQFKMRRDSGKSMGDKKGWYGLIRFGKKSDYEKIKILTPGEVNQNKFCIDRTKSGFLNARIFSITVESPELDLKYLLAYLNSKTIEFYLHHVSPPKAGGYYNYKSTVLDEIPLIIDGVNQTKFVELVDKILSAKDQKPDADTTLFEDEIDQMIYELFEFSKDEIALIENNCSSSLNT